MTNRHKGSRFETLVGRYRVPYWLATAAMRAGRGLVGVDALQEIE